MRAQRGEQDAFRALVERYQAQVYTLARRMVSSPQDAEDVAQEAFLNAWRGLPRFRMDAKFSTWLYRLTVNAASDLLRRRQRTQETPLDDEDSALQLPDPAPGPEEQAQQRQRRAALQQGINALSENHRKILLLRVVSDLDYAQIGEILELSPGTVKSRLARARIELRKILRQQGNYFSDTSSNQEKGGGTP
ncbi:MAG: sigma-70 family RNA polymerase sigma factor [Oscillospiraceae bacterium]|nr:sigma-70 family RNA polymerase sigma factor [Oscillospiraceae bacterium]